MLISQTVAFGQLQRLCLYVLELVGVAVRCPIMRSVNTDASMLPSGMIDIGHVIAAARVMRTGGNLLDELRLCPPLTDFDTTRRSLKNQ